MLRAEQALRSEQVAEQPRTASEAEWGDTVTVPGLPVSLSSHMSLLSLLPHSESAGWDLEVWGVLQCDSFWEEGVLDSLEARANMRGDFWL